MEAVPIRRARLLVVAAVLVQGALAGCGLFASSPAAPQPVPPAPVKAATATATVAAATYGPGETLGQLTVAHVITPSVATLAAAAAPLKLAAVQFATDTMGWVAGSRCPATGPCQGVILRTLDGGAKWSAPVVMPAAISGLQFLDTQNGWAFGPAALFSTRDGGVTWSRVALPAGLRGIAGVQASFADASSGWLIVHLQDCATQGCGVRVYETSDGGASWRQIASNAPTGQSAPGLAWAEYVAGGDLGGGHGWMLAQTPGGMIQTTADDGRTWTRQPLGSGGSPVGGAFAGNGNGWVAATADTGAAAVQVWQSIDDGGSWRRVVAVPGRLVDLDASSDGASAWLTLAGGVSVASALGTATAPVPVPGYNIVDISALDAATAWAVASGPGGYAVLATTNGGKAWHPVYRAAASLLPSGLWGFLAGGTDGWAIGSSVLRTSDGGRSWVKVGVAPVTSVLDAGFSDPQDGWLTDGQLLYLTSDGGASWSQVKQPAAAIAAVGFTTPLDGWLLPAATKVQPTPLLLVTHDGGRTWRGTGAGPFFSVAFASPSLGWAIGRGTDSHVHLLATTDGGAVWTAVADLGPQQWDPSGPPPLWVGARLAAATPDDVWIASGDHLLQSIDGGHTWVDLRGPAATRVVAAAGGYLWVGSGPAIYSVTAAGAAWTQVGWASGG
jgi:photosystem II stability/assembly factor-like uncharacterized protein